MKNLQIVKEFVLNNSLQVVFPLQLITKPFKNEAQTALFKGPVRTAL